ncbi:hypothetical protein BCR33DRAFT_853036 [Rhizoclosmatium globosum]|uniref:Uncharacterized protein n=2 Tax=Rhizoclosmatium globosum TaxID=329046 RepID=A0A1Y2BYQ0_9FUNG|nr:hypothetical protein BCR33DRAFT_853036 [Rhizoclosmatium globosum]|eukprot:ORY39899.1 hypothetical protein BCR33DRAFT_853036 [Rhizoclosmatium globosum]
MNTNSRGRGGIGGARKARAAAAGAKSNTAQIKTLSDLVKSLVKRQNAPTTRASRLWAKLRDHVKVGFFASLLNESETTPASFIDNIESLWLLVHKHSSEASVRRSIGGGGLVDSTTQFVAAGAAKLKEAKFAAERKTRANKTDSDDNVNVNANGNVDSDSRPHSADADADADADNEAQNKQSMDEDLDDENLGEDIPVGRKSKAATGRGRKTASKEAPIENQASQRSGFGIEGLSFDTVPNVNVTSELRIIAEGLFSQPIIEADYFTVQVNFNRGWKLLLIGLTQAECIGRYMAMCALKIAVPVINDTLLDSSTRQNILNSLVNLMISDCRLENRLKAVYLLGILAHQLGFIREHDNMLLRVFKELIKKLIDIQFKERKLSGDALLKYQADNRSMKIYLIYALGKFTTNLSQHSRYMEDLTIYALSNEFEHGDTRLQMKSDGTLKKGFPKGPLHVVKSVMSTLVHDIKHTEQNEKYVGAIFKSFVSPLLKVATEGVQMVAVQFVSTWLPVTNEDNGLLALDALQTGLKLVKDLEVESFDKSAYDREMAAYKKKMIAEESRMALRAKLLKQLLLTPGTYSRLLPVSDHPGFFADNNSSMFNTKAIAVGLPIHPKSNVLISRPIPNIPGVPSGVTTIPPVFMEPTWFEKIPIPSCYYEASERIGGIPGLPVGYTYAPTKLVDVYAIRGIEKAKKEPELPAQIKPIQEQQQPSKRISVLGRPSATGRVSKASKPQESVAEDTLPEEMTAPGAGFGFVKRRGTLRRVDVERGNDASDLPIPTGTTRQMPQEAGVRFEGMQRGDQMVRESKSTDQSRALVAKKIPPGFLNVSPFAGFDPDAVDSSAPVASAIYKDYEEDVEWEKPAPTGYTFDKNPVLWPNKNLSLKPVQCTTDFPLYAPVLFDIIQPGQSSLQQILCQVVGIDRDVSAVSVQRDSNANLLSAGATFNLFIRNRNTPTKWSCINLQVIDDDYRDAQSFGHRQRSVASLPSGQNSLTSLANAAEKGPLPGSPLPSGFTSTGDPYFPPPVNMPPMPAGYTPDMLPYYGKTPSVKPQPLGITTDGIKFYNSDGSLSEGQRNQVGGYDNLGQPFFIPKGCQLPVPIGFTPDGIAYFDVPSILNQKGIMLLPVPKKDRMQWPTFEEEDDSIIQLEIGPDGKPQPKKVTGAMLLEDLLTQLKVTQAEIGKTLVAERTLTTGAIRRLKDFNTDLSTILSPDSDDPAVLDPEDIIQYLKDKRQFQTVHSPETKNVVLRYRANRGDREERDFFMSVEPADVFTIPSFHLKLQGEGMSQIAVTFNPILVRSERVEGSLSLIDVTGKRLVSCELIGLRQSFIKITPSSIDAGWMLPEKKKELTSEANARAAVAQASAVLGSQGTNTAVVNERTVEEMKKRGFSIPQRALKLGPSESKMVPVIFEPYHLGRFSDGMKNSYRLYPENAEDSQAGGLALTPERTEFMKKFRKTASKDKRHDGGIHLKLSECAKGNIKTAIEVICPEFQNIPLYVKAYVGQPLYFNTWDIAYFKPCPAGVSDQLTLSVINEMTDDLSYFSCMFSDDDTKFSRVLGFSAFPVTFSFTARQRGPWMKHIAFKLNKAFNNMVLPTCPSGNRLTLVGICIEPYAHLPGSTPDKNGLEQLRLWMSHPKRVLDEYAQQDAERGKRFELISFSGRYTPRKPADDLDLTFQKEEIVFRQKLKGEDPMAQRRAQVQTVISRNKGLQSVPTLWIGSTQFNIEPRQKTLRPGAQDVVEVMYIPPPDAVENVTAVGFAAILSDEDHRYHAIQLLGKPALDFLIFPPCDKEGNVLLDFGTVETSTTGFEVNTKWMIMMNNYPQSYSWTLAFTHSKTKFNPFTANLLFGEMESGDSFPVAFSFKSDTSGYFESTVEVHAKAALDRTMKPIRVARVILRAISVNTSVTGFPDALDFGSTVVFKKKRKTFTLMNNGSIETKVSLHIRGPFAMHPKSFDLAPKAEQEGRNHRLDFDLSDKQGYPSIDHESDQATRPELIKIEYCDVTSTVPYSSSHSTKNAVSIRKNYWGILQRKFQVYLALRGIMKNNNLVSRDFTKTQDKRKDAFIDESGAVVPVFNSKPPFNALKESLFPLVPELRPFYSYHFKIGYLNKYQLNKETDVHFHYMPMTTQEDEASLPSLLREMSVSVTGTVFRPLEFFPNAIDFGITPIEILEELSWKNFGCSRSEP